jgi:hypothetical protein
VSSVLRLSQATDCAVAHVVTPSNLRQRLASLPTCKCFLDLVEVSFGFLPNRTPLALALWRPSLILDLISSRSNSAIEPRIFNGNRPCADVVSMAGLSRTRNPAPLSEIAASVLSKSRVERAKRSSLVTINRSPQVRLSIALRSSRRSVTAPPIFSA